MIGTGASPLRPNMACNKSACSVLRAARSMGHRAARQQLSVAISATARPIASDFNATPGPDVVVTPSEPPYEAPIAAPIPAISSAWNVRTPNSLCLLSSRRMSLLSDRLGAEIYRHWFVDPPPPYARAPPPAPPPVGAPPPPLISPPFPVFPPPSL